MTRRVYHRWADGRFRAKYERPPRKGTWQRIVHDMATAYMEQQAKELEDSRRKAGYLRSRGYFGKGAAHDA